MKAVTWKEVEKEVVGDEKKWWKNGAEGMLRRGGYFLTGGRWGGFRSTVGRFDDEYSEESDEWEFVDYDSCDDDVDDYDDSVSEEEGIEGDPATLLRRRITNERLKRAGHSAHYNNDSKKEEEKGNSVNNNVTSIKNQECDIQDENLPRTFNNSSKDSKNNKFFVQEPESYEMDDDYYIDDDDLNIPGSFPTAFKWTPQQSTTGDKLDKVRRVRSVLLRRPSRSGFFGGSGEFWVTNTRKVRTISNSKDKDITITRSSNKPSSITNKSTNKSSKSQKRTWVRRSSI